MTITLTWEQEKEIRNYFRIQDAISLLVCYDIEAEGRSDEELLKLGIAIENAAYDNMGDIEYAILGDFGYLEE